jgi:AcrR family transcriptional regulator
MKKPAEACDADHSGDGDGSHRARILNAAFQVLMERGYAGAGTLEIATRAKVSKRELYALFGSKQGILMELIAERAARMRQPLALPEVRDRAGLAETLVRFGTAILREACQPAVMAVYRLAVAESDRSPEVAQALNTAGREANRSALIELLARAQSCGLLDCGEPPAMAAQFFALLWGDLLVRLLLRVTDPPAPAEIESRARAATETLLRLHGSARSAEPGSAESADPV